MADKQQTINGDGTAKTSGNESVEEAVKKIQNTKSGGFQLSQPGKITFPGDLLDGHEAVRFEIFKDYQFDRTENLMEKGIAATIYLPIPNVLQPSYSASYQSTELGVVGRLGASLAGGGQEDTNSVGALANLAAQNSGALATAAGAGIGKLLGSVLKKTPKLGEAATAAGALTGAAAGQAAKGAQFGMGVARNPHMAQVFENIQFRSHDFSYKFSPKNIQEQNTLSNIIKMFKVAMHPKYLLGDHMFEYPAQFDIDIITGETNRHFYNVGVSVLTDMSVNYLPNGPHMHDIAGGFESKNIKAPIAVDITMKFTEIKIVTQDEIMESNY